MKTSSSDLGDFQTPAALVRIALRVVGRAVHDAVRVLEPSCGRGSFLEGLLEVAPAVREIKAFELQLEHLTEAQSVVSAMPRIELDLRVASLFDVDFGALPWKHDGPLLVVGNPPWITSASLGALRSENLPRKANVLGLRGLDAVTGAANFDLTEYVWWKALTELASEQPTVALLSKTSAARRAVILARHLGVALNHARMYRIDAKKWFGAAVDACLFIAEVGGARGPYRFEVYDQLEDSRPVHAAGYVGSELVAHTALYESTHLIENGAGLVWRQGVKHDAASIMELQLKDGLYVNRVGARVDIEREHIFPLLKGSDLHRGTTNGPTRAVIVTQRRLTDNPNRLATTAPRLWSYLTSNRAIFDRRRSSIYRNRPRFAMFGVGDYSFSLYKVAIAGLYKDARFRAVGPIDGKPVLFDDTCYFVAVATASEAALLSALLNQPQCRRFIESVVFWDSKRPITKKLLERISPAQLFEVVDRRTLETDAGAELVRLGDASSKPNWRSLLDALLTNDRSMQLPLEGTQVTA